MGTKGFADNVPCTIVVSGDLSYYPTERDRHLIYIDSALAGMQLMLALETLGLSSCPINWPDLEDKEIKISNLLNLPQTIRPTMLIAVGYGANEGKIPYSQKKSANQLINYI
jgi:nitroreductase